MKRFTGSVIVLGMRRGCSVALLAVVCMLFGIVTSAAYATPLEFAGPTAWYDAQTPTPNGSFQYARDVNGDGKADLVWVTDAATFVALSTGTDFATPAQWAKSSCIPDNGCRSHRLADVNGDGRADLVSFRSQESTQDGGTNVFVSMSDGSKFGAAERWNDDFCLYPQTCDLGDVNGDGRADLVAFTHETGLVWVSLSTGTGFSTNTVWHNYFCIGAEQCFVGDANGDGRDDLILFKANIKGALQGNVLVSLSNGDGFAPAALWHGYFCISGEKCIVADVNGDRRLDIVLLKLAQDQRPGQDQQYEALVALSNGHQFINADPFSWNKAMVPYVIGATDVTGDGRADLVTYKSLGDGREQILIGETAEVASPPPTTSSPSPCGARSSLCCTTGPTCNSGDLYCDATNHCSSRQSNSPCTNGGQPEIIQMCAVCDFKDYYLYHVTCDAARERVQFEEQYADCNVVDGPGECDPTAANSDYRTIPKAKLE